MTFTVRIRIEQCVLVKVCLADNFFYHSGWLFVVFAPLSLLHGIVWMSRFRSFFVVVAPFLLIFCSLCAIYIKSASVSKCVTVAEWEYNANVYYCVHKYVPCCINKQCTCCDGKVRWRWEEEEKTFNIKYLQKLLGECEMPNKIVRQWAMLEELNDARGQRGRVGL